MSDIAGISARDQVQRYIESRAGAKKPLVTVLWNSPQAFDDGHRQRLVGRQAHGPAEGLSSPAAATRWLRDHGITSGATVKVDRRHVPVSFTEQVDAPVRTRRIETPTRVERGTWATRHHFDVSTGPVPLESKGFYRHGKMPVTDVVAGNQLLRNRGTMLARRAGIGLAIAAFLGAASVPGILSMRRDQPSEQPTDSTGHSGWQGSGESPGSGDY